jgi:hypothetical protein
MELEPIRMRLHKTSGENMECNEITCALVYMQLLLTLLRRLIYCIRFLQKEPLIYIVGPGQS